MQLQTKALYNLLKLHADEGGVTDFKPWQIEDLRLLSEEELFSRLLQLGVNFDKERFSLFADECDTPEDLLEVIAEISEDKEKADKTYLIIFELWRRLFPQRQSLSIFCDELDYRIEDYLQNSSLDTDELTQDALANLEDILDGNVDSGAAPDYVFQSLQQFCAHDLEAFLYEYIAEQISSGNELYASELIDGFYAYLSNLKWFDFLRVRLIATEDIADANAIIEHIYKEVVAAPDYVLQWELIKFLVQEGDVDLFIKFVLLSLHGIEKEEKFQKLLSKVAEFYRRLDLDAKEKQILKMLKKRQSEKKSDGMVSRLDEDLGSIKELLKS